MGVRHVVESQQNCMSLRTGWVGQSKVGVVFNCVKVAHACYSRSNPVVSDTDCIAVKECSDVVPCVNRLA